MIVFIMKSKPRGFLILNRGSMAGGMRIALFVVANAASKHSPKIFPAHQVENRLGGRQHGRPIFRGGPMDDGSEWLRRYSSVIGFASECEEAMRSASPTNSSLGWSNVAAITRVRVSLA